MKIVMRRIIGLLFLLSGVLSLDAMFTQSRNVSKIYSNKRLSKSSFVSTSPSDSVDATVGQKSEMEMKQPTTFWESLKSWEVKLPSFLMPKKTLAQEINEILIPLYPGFSVNENDLKRAQKQLGYIINSNPNAKSYIVETIDEGNGVIQSLTILDKVLFIVSQLTKSELSLVRQDEKIPVLAQQRMWYFTELIKSLARVDAQINQENSDIYLDTFKTLLLLYRKALDQQFKKKSHGYTATSVDSKVEFLQEELTILTDVFKKLIPGFRQFKLEIEFKSFANEKLKASRREKYRQERISRHE